MVGGLPGPAIGQRSVERHGEMQQRYAGSVAIQVRLRAASRVTSACPLRTNAEA